MSIRRKKIKVIERKLGREAAWGQACITDRVIEIDPRVQNERRRLTVLIHEAIHLADWDLSEKRVTDIAPKVCKVLWDQGYRRTLQ